MKDNHIEVSSEEKSEIFFKEVHKIEGDLFDAIEDSKGYLEDVFKNDYTEDLSVLDKALEEKLVDIKEDIRRSWKMYLSDLSREHEDNIERFLIYYLGSCSIEEYREGIKIYDSGNDEVFKQTELSRYLESLVEHDFNFRKNEIKHVLASKIIKEIRFRKILKECNIVDFEKYASSIKENIEDLYIRDTDKEIYERVFKILEDVKQERVQNENLDV